MYIIIVGADSIGRALTELFLAEKHNVVIIEPDEELAQRAVNNYDAQVFQSDIAAEGILEEAGVDKADVLFAVTASDAENLLALSLGALYGIETLVTIVGKDQNRQVFEKLNAQILTNPYALIARRLSDMATSA